MKRLINILVFFLILSFSLSGLCSEHIPVELDSFYGEAEWSPDSQKIALYDNGAVYVISLDGQKKKIRESDALYILNLDWLNNEKVIFCDDYIIEIIDINSLATETYFVEDLFFYSYSKKRNEIAFSSRGKIKLLNLERRRIKTLVYYNQINRLFYNKNGDRLFFIGYGRYGSGPFLYTFNFKSWAFDRVSKESLEPVHINKSKDILYCIKGSEGKDMVAVDMNTLEVYDYEPETDLEIRGVKIDSNFSELVKISGKNLHIFLAPDNKKVFFVKDNKGEFVFLE